MDTPAPHPQLDALLDHSEWLHALARRLVSDPAAADDLVQETWIAALRHPPDASRPARPWLAGVLRNLVLLRRRTEGRREHRQREAARPDRLPSAAAIAESVDAGRRLAGLVLELAEPYRTTVLLRYWHDLSSAEIARRQGIPEGTVRWRLKHGVDALRERLDGTYGARRSWHTVFFAMLDARELSREGAVAGMGGAAAWIVASAALLAGLLVTWRAVAGGAPRRSEPLVAVELAPAEVAAAPRAEESPGERSALEGASVVRRVRVLDAIGAPVVDADVVIDDGSAEGVHVSTDAEGVARFDGSLEAVSVYARAEGAYVVAGALAEGEIEAELRVPDGHELSGRIVVDGLPPGERIRLALALDHPLLEGAIPVPVERVFGSARRAITFSEEDGHFRFRGLDRGWRGTLEIPRTWRLPDARGGGSGPRIRYDAPRAGVVIELVRRPHLSGSVDGADGTVAVGASVELEARWSDGAVAFARDRTDAAGRYDLLLEDERFAGGSPEDVVLRATAREGGEAAERALAPADVADGVELETLVLAPTPPAPAEPALEIVVRCDAPALLGGLRAELAGADHARAIGPFAVEEEGARARVDGELRLPLRVRIADAADRVLLERELAPDDLESGALELELDVELHELRMLVEDERARPIVGAVGTVPGTRVKTRTDEYGWLALRPLVAGELELVLEHPAYATRAVRALVGGGAASECTRVLGPAHELVVEIIDEASRPVLGARVDAHREGGPRWTADELGEGRYRLTRLDPDPVVLAIAWQDRVHELRADPLDALVRVALPPASAVAR